MCSIARSTFGRIRSIKHLFFKLGTVRSTIAIDLTTRFVILKNIKMLFNDRNGTNALLKSRHNYNNNCTNFVYPILALSYYNIVIYRQYISLLGFQRVLIILYRSMRYPRLPITTKKKKQFMCTIIKTSM